MARKFYYKCNSPIDCTSEQNAFVESYQINNDINLSRGACTSSPNWFIRDDYVNEGTDANIYKEHVKSGTFKAMINDNLLLILEKECMKFIWNLFMTGGKFVLMKNTK